jgi:predicted transcriptional regulator
MTVGAHCNRNVATIKETAAIADAAVLMREAHVGDLIVMDSQGTSPIGVITDRDIVIELIAEDVDLKTVTVGDIMTGSIATVNESNGLEFALKEMHRCGIRRIAVTDSDHKLVGVLSLDDVVNYLMSLLDHLGGAIRQGLYQESRDRP